MCKKMLALVFATLLLSGCGGLLGAGQLAHGLAVEAHTNYELIGVEETPDGPVLHKKMIRPAAVDLTADYYILEEKEVGTVHITLERQDRGILKDTYHVFRYHGDIYDPQTKIEELGKSITLGGGEEDFAKACEMEAT